MILVDKQVCNEIRLRIKAYKLFLMLLSAMIMLCGCLTIPENQQSEIQYPEIYAPNIQKQGALSLSENELKIADALYTILSQWISSSIYLELPELLSFEDSIVQVVYYQGYDWHEADRPDTTLLELAPEGITCIVRVPSASGRELAPDKAIYYSFCLGRNSDGKYNTEVYHSYASGGKSIDEYFSYRSDYLHPSPENIAEFEFHFPARDSTPDNFFDDGYIDNGNEKPEINENLGTGNEETKIYNENLETWIGEYSFTEIWESLAHELPTGLMLYSIRVNINEGGYYAEMYIDGHMTMKRLKARVIGNEEFIKLIFKTYLPDNMNFVIEPYKEGDLLLCFKRDNAEIITRWGALTPALPENSQEGVYFTKTDDK